MHNKKYSKDIMKKFGMFNCKPTSTPLDPNVKTSAHEGKDLEDATIDQRLASNLIYLNLTRPDIYNTLGVMCRYMKNQKKSHMDGVRRIFIYLKSTIDYGLVHKKSEECKLIGYFNSYYEGDPDTPCSTTVFVIKLGAGAISWCSKRQASVTLNNRSRVLGSSSFNLGKYMAYAVPMYCDNQLAIYSAENPILQSRTETLDIHYHFIWEKVLQGEIVLSTLKWNIKLHNCSPKVLVSTS